MNKHVIEFGVQEERLYQDIVHILTTKCPIHIFPRLLEILFFKYRDNFHAHDLSAIFFSCCELDCTYFQ